MTRVRVALRHYSAARTEKRRSSVSASDMTDVEPEQPSAKIASGVSDDEASRDMELAETRRRPSRVLRRARRDQRK